VGVVIRGGHGWGVMVVVVVGGGVVIGGEGGGGHGRCGQG
jgi:hypothetical protein